MNYTHMDMQKAYDQTSAATLGQVPDRALASIKDKIGVLVEKAAQLSSRIESVGSRAFGDAPIGNGSLSDSAACAGDVGFINDALDALSGELSRAHDAIARLESL